MSDCLSHSCPNGCKDGRVFDHTGWHDCSYCIAGYPREAVERAAKDLHDFVVGFVTIHEFSDPGFSLNDAREATLIAIRAFHNEGTVDD